MNRALGLFYDNEELREAVYSFLKQFIRSRSLEINLARSNEEIGGEARALRKCEELIDEAWNEMAASSKKVVKNEENPAI